MFNVVIDSLWKAKMLNRRDPPDRTDISPTVFNTSYSSILDSFPHLSGKLHRILEHAALFISRSQSRILRTIVS